MKTESTAKDSDMVTQEHCIDLPGESVQCWIGGGTNKLKVILRKHRDVIFDIHLNNRKTYTVEASESDFYNARDKKLVHAKRHEKVTFNDGERMHVWVSRNFRGTLILKCDDHVISKFKPNELDKNHHSDDPKEKPAPIIVAMSAPPSSEKKSAPNESIDIAKLGQEAQSLHIHEVSKNGSPPLILKFFEDGGESMDLDSENTITRNWIIAQLTGAAGYVVDNRTWINELKGCMFRLQTVRHQSGAKVYMIFNGNNRLRQIMSASRYSFQHTKIMRITGGAGDVKQAWDTTKGAIKDSVTVIAKDEGKMVVKAGGIAVVFSISMDIAEWYKDYSEIGPDGKPKKDFYDLFSKLSTDLVKGAAVAALTTASIACCFGAMAFFGFAVAAPVVLVVVGTIVVSVLFTLAFEKIDKAIGRALGEQDSTTWLSKKFREIAKHLATVSKDVRYADYEFTPI